MAVIADVRRNRLLRGLPADSLARIASDLSFVDLPRGTVIHASGERVAWVLFPLDGLASLVGLDDAVSGVDVAIVGRDGMLGAHSALASLALPIEAVQQIAGKAARMTAVNFRKAMERETPLQHAVTRYLAVIFVETAQGSACNRMHDLRSRLGRWLLMMVDRTGQQELALTHESLARMAGASRPKVSQAVAELVAVGGVETRRAYVHVADRVALESQACGCYGIIRAVRNRLSSMPEASRDRATA